MPSFGFDLDVYCDNLKATKPPYECPVRTCGRIYKSYCGIRFHLYKFDHDNPDNNAPSPALSDSAKKKKKKGGRQLPLRRSPSPSPVEFLRPQGREPLTYAEAQRLVEIEFQGRVFRLDINEPLEVVLQDEIDNQENLEKEESKSKNKHHDTPKPRKESGSSQHTQHAKLPEAQFKVLSDYAKPPPAPELPKTYYRYIEKSMEELDSEVEYDMDEEDYAWLELVNESRQADGSTNVTQDTFELLMDRFEKEAYFQSQSSGKPDPSSLIDEDAVCSICLDGECQNSNVILFCDMCNLAVHQECYGVPYIPEGQWLCRRCLQSPSCAVECCLCPNRGGAFKQTDDGRWAHVVCAFWIPEVGFANTVFLEPIDSIIHIPPARWKLTCYICKQRGAGACIQCHKTNCYTAFHVTCAQQAGLYMKIEPVRDATSNSPGMAVRKTAFCDTHTPPDKKGTPMISNGDSDEEYFQATSRKAKVQSKLKMRKARKILAEKRNMMPVVSIPVIPQKKLSKIGAKVTLAKKQHFISLLYSYWTLKRQSRNGVPLIRRLQSNHMSRNKNETKDDAESNELKGQLKYWQRLRQDLEKARLLVELIRKREKLKREHVRLKQMEMEFRLHPFLLLLRNCLDQVQAKDHYNIFAEPVSLKEVPDYLKFIKTPMDFSTMRKRIEGHQYKGIDGFERDFDLIVTNCMTYNSKDTLFYKAATKLRDQGGAIIRATRRIMDKVGYDIEAGTHLAEAPDKVSDDDLPISENIKDLLPPDVRSDMSLEDQLRTLLDSMDQANAGRRNKLARQIKGEIRKVRRQLALKKCEILNSSLDEANESAAGRIEIISPRKTIRTPRSRRKLTPKRNKRKKHVQPRLKLCNINNSNAAVNSPKKENSPSKELKSPDSAVEKSDSKCHDKSFDYQNAFLNFVRKPSIHDNSQRKCSPSKRGRGRPKRLLSSSIARSPEKDNEVEIAPKEAVETVMEGGAEVAASVSNNEDKHSTDGLVNDAGSMGSADNSGRRAAASPLGVNRRTAVLFGKKARKNTCADTPPDTPPATVKKGLGRSSRSKSSYVVQAQLSLEIPDEETPGEVPPLLEPTKVPKSPSKRKRTASASAPDTELQPKEKARKTSYVMENGPDLALPESPKSAGDRDRDTPPVLKPQSPTRLNPNSPSQRESFFAYRTDRSLSSSESDETSDSNSDVSETESSASGGSGTADKDGNAPRHSQRDSSSVRHAKTHIWRELIDDVIPLEPLDLVWAKCRGYPWYPALIINPKMPKTGYFHNGVPIPVPPADVLTLQRKFDEPVYLVLFFDAKRTWQWLPRGKLEPLGVDSGLDDVKLNDQKRPQIRKSVRMAYEKAVSHRCRVTGEPNTFVRLAKDRDLESD